MGAVPDYEAILAVLADENAARIDQSREPDTPEYAAERTEITEALLDEQLTIIAHGHRRKGGN